MTARWCKADGQGRVICELCARECRVQPGKTGWCGVRENRDGSLVSRVHDGKQGLVVAQQVDPIEKKPLHHVEPGSLSYSIATVGCNLGCVFCQNAQIAQWPARTRRNLPGEWLSPETLVDRALAENCRSISYTYTEPTVYLELVEDTARLARRAGLLNIMVTNGFMGRGARTSMCDWLDAANVDLKAFSNSFYKQFCKATLAPVLENLEALKKGGVWLEVTTLVIPGLNDSVEELGALAAFIADRLGRETPWHLSRFHPCHDLTDRGPTPVDTLERAVEIGRRAGLDHVYLGNVPGSEFEHTHCPGCGTRVVRRRGYLTQDHTKPGGRCPDCGETIPGLFGPPGPES
ncbi:MAG: AmmeMemoRadiSam system radical SAM enzyme [Desulfobacterales bacterium]|nr:AmmeMemoRadiSam system radical SAM enzyme [Desulfobacterales bacterium]